MASTGCAAGRVPHRRPVPGRGAVPTVRTAVATAPDVNGTRPYAVGQEEGIAHREPEVRMDATTAGRCTRATTRHRVLDHLPTRSAECAAKLKPNMAHPGRGTPLSRGAGDGRRRDDLVSAVERRCPASCSSRAVGRRGSHEPERDERQGPAPWEPSFLLRSGQAVKPGAKAWKGDDANRAGRGYGHCARRTAPRFGRLGTAAEKAAP